MNPVNHMFTGWLVANSNRNFGTRERLVITLGCLVPDLDGFGIIADMLTARSNHPLTWWAGFHHVLGHNLLFGLLFALAVYVISNRNLLVAGLSLLTFHLHLIEDFLIGRHGEGHVWTIQYMYPFNRIEWGWSGQMELNAWPNFVIAIVFLALFRLCGGDGRFFRWSSGRLASRGCVYCLDMLGDSLVNAGKRSRMQLSITHLRQITFIHQKPGQTILSCPPLPAVPPE